MHSWVCSASNLKWLTLTPHANSWVMSWSSVLAGVNCCNTYFVDFNSPAAASTFRASTAYYSSRAQATPVSRAAYACCIAFSLPTLLSLWLWVLVNSGGVQMPSASMQQWRQKRAGVFSSAQVSSLNSFETFRKVIIWWYRVDINRHLQVPHLHNRTNVHMYSIAHTFRI